MSLDHEMPTTSPFHRTHLFTDSQGISVFDCRCRLHRHETQGPEEAVDRASVVFVRRGVFQRSWRGNALIADANQVLFFNPGEGYRYAHPMEGGDDCTVFELPAHVLERLIGHERTTPKHPDRLFRRGHALASSRAVRLQYEVLEWIRRPTAALMQEDALADLLGEVIAGGPAEYTLTPDPSLPARKRRELAEEAKLAIGQRLDRPPTLSELAAGLECSPFHLSRLFRQTVGITLRAYLGRLRTRAGAERLAMNPTIGLSRLAFELGYSDHSHFTNAFRQEFGLPPSRFAARAAAQEVPSHGSS